MSGYDISFDYVEKPDGGTVLRSLITLPKDITEEQLDEFFKEYERRFNREYERRLEQELDRAFFRCLELGL